MAGVPFRGLTFRCCRRRGGHGRGGGAGRRGGNTSDGESSSFGAHSRNIFIFSLSLGAEY